jgi:hypothetical protein
MSTECQVRRRVQDALANALDFEELIETGGLAFSDGRCIEVLRDDVGSLVLLDSKSGESHHRVEI